MQAVKAGQANVLTFDAVAVDGTAIVSGTVTSHLRAINGVNADKWFRSSDSTWQVAEASAGNMAFVANSLWDVSIVSAAWTTGIVYTFYGKESGGLHIPYNEQVVTGFIKPEIGIRTFTYTLTYVVSGNPIPDAVVEVYSDLAMSALIATGRTDVLGVVVFYLQPATYYLKRLKAGVDFVNPDIEVVA